MKMFFSRQLKKALAFTAALALFSAIIPANLSVSYADEMNKSIIYIDYLGQSVRADNPSGRGPSDKKIDERPAFTEEQVGCVFWVGVRVKDMNMTSFIQRSGIRDMEIAFDYNSKYIIPADDLEPVSAEDIAGKLADYNSSKGAVEAKWLNIIKEYNFIKEEDEDSTADRALWGKNYDIGRGASADAVDSPDDSPGREPTNTQMDSGIWKSAFVSVRKINEVGNEWSTRFHNVQPDGESDGYYLIRMPFMLIDAPRDGTEPEALILSRGPSTFLFTTDDNDDLEYAWEASDRLPEPILSPTHNLKNYFDYGGELNIFQKAEGISDLQLNYIVSDGEDTVSKPIALHQNAEQNDNETLYKPDTFVYYISVPEGTENINFITKGTSTAPYVEHGDYSSPAAFEEVTDITKNADTWNGSVTLSGIVAASGPENTPDVEGVPSDSSYKNVIRFTAGEKTYTLHVRYERKQPSGEARIELSPGNSPYGLIERMAEKYHGADGAWDEEKIAAAKAAFDVGNMFTAEYLPDGAAAGQEYSPNAWIGEGGATENITNSAINMDRNVNAQFLFNGTEFVDAGFAAYDSHGDKVDDKAVTRTITVKKMADYSASQMVDSAVTDETITIAETESGTASDAFQNIGAIRPGVYEMTYSYEDPYTGNIVEAKRNIIITWQMGDTDLSGILNSTDADMINHILAGRMEVYAGVDEQAVNIYKFRIMDFDRSSIINSTDADNINHVLAGRLVAGTDVFDFYSNITSID